MNIYRWEEIKVGMQEAFQVTITEEMVAKFTAITGDVNPMHIEKEYAVKRGYDNRLVYGMLTASFYSTLAGVYLPGKNCILQECNTSFHKPVYVGDTLHITGKVTELHEIFHCMTIKAVIRNQNGERVSKATIVAGVMDSES